MDGRWTCVGAIRSACRIRAMFSCMVKGTEPRMKSEQFDAFSRILARSESRRSAIRKIAGIGLSTAGLAVSSRISAAQDATPVAASGALSDAQAALDAMDPDTRDSIARAIWKTELKAEDLDAEVLAKILDP